jgi:hypothetical protein
MKRIPVLYLSFLAVFAFAFSALDSDHDVYNSLTIAEYNPESKAIEVSLKLFTDDADQCLGRFYRENINLGEADEHPASDSLLLNYINQRLTFSCGGVRLTPRYYGKEVGIEETWVYFDYPVDCATDEMLHVDNRIFTEAFSAQVNLVKFSGPGIPDQRLQLLAENTTGTFNWR